MNRTLRNQTSGTERLGQESYDPDALLDLLLKKMHLSRDSQLAQRINIDRRVLYHIRLRQMNITGSMLILMHEASGLPVAVLKQILKDRRKTSRMECTFVAEDMAERLANHNDSGMRATRPPVPHFPVISHVEQAELQDNASKSS